MVKCSTPFFEIKYSELKSRTDIILLSWVAQFPWKHGTSIYGMRELDREFSIQFGNNDQPNILKNNAVNSLIREYKQDLQGVNTSDDVSFFNPALEYFLKAKFHMPTHLERYSDKFKLEWIISRFAYEEFNQYLQTNEKLSIGAPKLEADINERRHQFVSHCTGIFYSWAFELYRTYDEALTFPITIDLHGAKNTYRPTFITLHNHVEMNALYISLRDKARVRFFRELQDTLRVNETYPKKASCAEILKSLDGEVGLISKVSGELTDENTIEKSLSKGQSHAKNEKKKNYSANSIDIRLIYQTDIKFLRTKSLF